MRAVRRGGLAVNKECNQATRRRRRDWDAGAVEACPLGAAVWPQRVTASVAVLWL